MTFDSAINGLTTCFYEVRGSIPTTDCMRKWLSQSMLIALTGFLRDLRLPLLSTFMTLERVLFHQIHPFTQEEWEGGAAVLKVDVTI